MQYSLYILIIVIFFTSCTPNNEKIKGNGNVQNKTFAIEDFVELESNGAFEITFIQDTLWQINISAESNILPLIDVYKQSNKLIIEQEDHYSFDLNYPIKIEIHHGGIDEINFSGAGLLKLGYMQVNTFSTNVSGVGEVTGNVNASEIDFLLSGTGMIDVVVDCNELETSLSGSGDLTFEGVAINSIYSIAGVGNINAYDLISDYVWCNISGMGEVKLYVNKELDIDISGTGNISYKGDGLVNNSNISGAGNISKINK